MSSLADLLSIGAPGSLSAATPHGMLFNIPQAAPQAPPQQMRQPSKLGSLLGMLGDALLVAHGQAPIYHDRMQQQQQTQALQGFLTNPDDAIAKLMQVNPTLGIELYRGAHPPSEKTMEQKVFEYEQDLDPAQRPAFEKSIALTHPGMMTPVTMEAGSTVVPPGASGPPQQAVDYLKAHPELAPHFDEKYGPGSAAQILGGATASTPSLPFR